MYTVGRGEKSTFKLTYMEYFISQSSSCTDSRCEGCYRSLDDCPICKASDEA